MKSFVDNDFPGYLLDMNEFEPVGPLEEVSHTKICLFRHIKFGKEFYVRFPPESDNIPAAQRKFLDEVWIQIRLRHPAIQLFRGFSLPRDGIKFPAAFFFDHDDVMTLQDIIDLEIENKAPPEWNPTKKSCVIFGITAALKYVHSQHIIHNNIKTTKILLNKDFEPMLSDFSNAAIVSSCTDGCLTKKSGTALWRSPEMFNNEPYTLPSDVYSFGQVIHSIVTLKYPFPSKINYNDLEIKIRQWSDDSILEASKDFPPEFEGGYLDVYQTAVLPNPADRPKMEQFYEALLNNDIVFPGTNMEEYRNYCNRIAKYDH